LQAVCKRRSMVRLSGAGDRVNNDSCARLDESKILMLVVLTVKEFHRDIRMRLAF
jgi:hypothetical protein